MKILETERLLLRTLIHTDLQPMLDINQDPKVMEYFPSLQDLRATKAFITRVEQHFDKHGYSLYACIRKDLNEFIGFIGLLTPRFEAHFTPTTEIGWRLSSRHWGQGFATEGAKAVLDYAFRELKLPEIVSFTSVENIKSTRVMEKIGLQHNPNDNFDLPGLDKDHPLKHQVLYRLTRKEYLDISDMENIKTSLTQLGSYEVGCFYNMLAQFNNFIVPELIKMPECDYPTFLIEEQVLGYEDILQTKGYKHFKCLKAFHELGKIFKLANYWYQECHDKKSALNTEKEISSVAKRLHPKISDFCKKLRETAVSCKQDEYFSGNFE
ncbi:MAG: GNAT family N-acetyltransferase [Epsilonproteobacteria bacterium]|nr:GNAT family N-acetyltransferase [Campylobacterota bacterium]